MFSNTTVKAGNFKKIHLINQHHGCEVYSVCARVCTEYTPTHSVWELMLSMLSFDSFTWNLPTTFSPLGFIQWPHGTRINFYHDESLGQVIKKTAHFNLLVNYSTPVHRLMYWKSQRPLLSSNQYNTEQNNSLRNSCVESIPLSLTLLEYGVPYKNIWVDISLLLLILWLVSNADFFKSISLKVYPKCKLYLNFSNNWVNQLFILYSSWVVLIIFLFYRKSCAEVRSD